MSDGFERVDDVEIAELIELFKKLKDPAMNETAAIFSAQILSMRRLITSQHKAHQELLTSQNKAHQELLTEQRNLVLWQRLLTIATFALVIVTTLMAWWSKDETAIGTSSKTIQMTSLAPSTQPTIEHNR